MGETRATQISPGINVRGQSSITNIFLPPAYPSLELNRGGRRRPFNRRDGSQEPATTVGNPALDVVHRPSAKIRFQSAPTVSGIFTSTVHSSLP